MDGTLVVTHTDLMEEQLEEHQIGGEAIVRAIPKLIAEHCEKKLKTEFTKSVVQQGRHDHPQFNWIICHSKHRANFKGTKGMDWDHKEENVEVNGKMVKYDVYFAREGEFLNQGSKGSVDWAYDGFYEVTRKSEGKHIIFKRPPST